ncbi:MAG: ergothioneine biosynthesis protein EgtB [Chloroflexi bacterium]|nr:ergothioneine biosynthesis protein EgtB [Chloroflexota bacterium]
MSPLTLEPHATDTVRQALRARFQAVRQFSEGLCAPLAVEDYVVQSMPDCSPTKWHLAHVSWFFETFLLKPNIAAYQSPDPDYVYLFNSYYNAVGDKYPRPRRGMISRPTVEDVYRYRAHVDEHVLDLLECCDPAALDRISQIVTLGLNHEQQHQELILTDLKHMLSHNPLHPAYLERGPDAASPHGPLTWRSFPEGVYWIGHAGDSFAFDNEEPRHREFIHPFHIASRPATNAEYLEFMHDGGYQHSDLWLSMGWATVQQDGWRAPLYWEERDGEWWQFTLSGLRPVNPDEPVAHLSYFEADAFARWAGGRLPTEAEWEVAAEDVPIDGNFADNGRFHPQGATTSGDLSLEQMYGEVWEWTQSSYSPYPGFRTAAGALGEYNGKFMCNQYVLRGGSCATPRSHIRPTYRNFFPPDARWQFSGLRLAKDA